MIAKGVAGTNGDAFAARVDALYGTRDWRQVQLARDRGVISAVPAPGPRRASRHLPGQLRLAPLCLLGRRLRARLRGGDPGFETRLRLRLTAFPGHAAAPLQPGIVATSRLPAAPGPRTAPGSRPCAAAMTAS
jgi:hypothetical protein